MKQVADLTCCRALFAGWVFAYHLNLQILYAPHVVLLGPLVEHGALGVDGFFILSGMVLAYAHPQLSPRMSEMWRFWAKRLMRIYPVHLATIVLLAALLCGALALHVHPRDPGRFSTSELLNNLALVHAWGVSDRWAWNYPSWSISAEWAGYLAFPCIWPAVRRQKASGLVVLLPLTFAGVAGAYWIAHVHDLSLTYDGGLLRFFPEFIAGMAILPLLESCPRGIPGRSCAAGGAIIACGGAVIGSEVATIVGLWVLLFGLLLAARQRRPMILGRVPGLHRLGEISYSYYMSFAVIETLQATLWRHFDMSPRDYPVLYAVSTTALTFALAFCLWRIVEQPALRWFSVTMQRRPAAGTTAPLPSMLRLSGD